MRQICLTSPPIPVSGGRRAPTPRFHITAREWEFAGAGKRAHPAKILPDIDLGGGEIILCWRDSTFSYCFTATV
jgi:hypothetical protein